MMFQHSCQCGHILDISASSAGTLVSCHCGREVKIPKLSELKRLLGHDEERLVLGIADYLRTMYLDKQLPPDTHSVICQVITPDTLPCWVECERARASSGGWLLLLFAAISPVFAMRAYANNMEQYATGNDLVVRAPLPICANCLHTTSRSASNIRKLLLGVDLYRELLEAYPAARVGAG